MKIFKIEMIENTVGGFCAEAEKFTARVSNDNNDTVAEVTFDFDECGGLDIQLHPVDMDVFSFALVNSVMRSIYDAYTSEHELITDVFHDKNGEPVILECLVD